MNINILVIGLTGLEIKPKSTAPEADAFTTRPSERLTEYQWVGYASSKIRSALQKSRLNIGQ